MQRSLFSFGTIVVLGIIVLFVNSIASLLLGNASLDLTDDGLYTLSQGSRNVVRKLEEPVALKLYISRTDGAKYPAVKIYGDRVQHLAREYARASGGKIRVEVYDPRPDSEEESWAQKYGLSPLALPNGDRIFFGIAAVSASGKEESIPLVDLNRQEYLEYDLTRLLLTVAGGQKKGIGILSSLKLNGKEVPTMPGMPPQPDAQEPWVLINQLSNLGDVKFIDNGVSEIDPSIQVLMVVHPKRLSPQTLYAIDQFVMRGGNLFVAVDPYCSVDMPADGASSSQAMLADKSSNLKELLGPWGIEMVERKAVGDSEVAAKVSTGPSSPPEDFVLWLNLIRGQAGPDVINTKDMTTSKLENILLPWAGALKVHPLEGVSYDTLLQTSRQAGLVDEAEYRYGGGTPSSILNHFQRGAEPQLLAVRLNGKLKSAFKEKPQGVTGAAQSAEQLKESKEPVHVVVVSDVDFLSDMSSARVQSIMGTKIVNLINDNLPFAGNVIENLLGSNDLIGLRSRGQFARPFTRVEEIERHAAEKWRAEEQMFQTTLNEANSRLTELQEGSKPGSEQMFNKAVLDEMKQLRERRQDAQERLRSVRRNLRQDKERLGQILFVMNTFLVPAVLVLGSLIQPRKRKRSKTSAGQKAGQGARQKEPAGAEK